MVAALGVDARGSGRLGLPDGLAYEHSEQLAAPQWRGGKLRALSETSVLPAGEACQAPADLTSVPEPVAERPDCANAGEPAGVPVFVMLPLDTVNVDGVFRYASSRWFASALGQLAASGVHGVAVDVWWGAVERSPRRYDWSGYRQLFELVRGAGLRLQVVLSFHACGGNVGDSAQVPLPRWVLKAGEQDPDLFFTDRPREGARGHRNREYISFFADEAPRALAGRSPLECYGDLMRAFRDAFRAELGGLIEEVVVGAGPCGELRFPSYPEANGWRFPGVGEFQCYDRRALASLAQAAQEAGHSEWGYSGPHDSGSYNSTPEETPFFRGWGGSWDTPYGRFFLSWYSGALLTHGERLVAAATSIFTTAAAPRCTLSMHAAPERSIAHAGPAYGIPGLGPDPNPIPSSDSGDAGSGASTPTGFDGSAGARTRTANAGTANLATGVPVADEAAEARGAGFPGFNVVGRTLSGMSAMSTSTSVSTADGNEVADSTPECVGNGSDALHGSDSNGAAAASPPAQAGGGGQALGIGYAGSGGALRRPGKSVSLVSLGSDDGEGYPPPTTRSEDGECWRARSPNRPAGAPVDVSLKVAGIHWYFRSRSHAAELTAGYYNVDGRDGYNAIVEMCAEYGAALTLTCVEMCDAQHPPHALCGPEGLLRQVREASAAAGVRLGGENALPCFSSAHADAAALDRIVYNTRAWAPPLQEDAALKAALYHSPSVRSMGSCASGSSDSLAAFDPGAARDARMVRGARGRLPQAELPTMRSFTFLRLAPEMLEPPYKPTFSRFAKEAVGSAQQKATEVFHQTKDTVLGKTEEAQKTAGDYASQAKDKASDLAGTAQDKAHGAAGTAQDKAGDLQGQAKSTYDQAGSKASELGSKAQGAAKDTKAKATS
ncbi:hypothetical protein WJX81_003753 [Elliptochloris bilobata]|uniref:Beta-amylase n=1 Tax=Elliptochloris bilobata TaxID=381761 RepID=A0AAW1R3S9_9CHLO